ncbi:hypothetical protein UlMin_015721 [Ulmus minor]
MEKMLRRAAKLHADKVNLKHKDQVTQMTLIQLREVVYEAEDILIDCLIRYDHRMHRYLLRIIAPNFLRQTSKKLREINNQLKELMEFLIKLPLPDNKTQTKHEEAIVMSQNCSVDVPIGLDNDLVKIKGWISGKNKQLQRIAIWGMGGLGKTRIAQEIYSDREVYEKFDVIIWVTVSQNFNEYRILEHMLKKLRETGSADGSDFMRKIKQKLENKTCLVVFDDLWSIDEIIWWTDLCAVLASTVSGRSSCIIATTRFKGVADTPDSIHQPKTLNADNSWELFSRFAFPSSEGNRLKSQFEKIGKEIVKKCGGLPLAIKAIAPLMSSKTTIAEWTAVQESYHNSLIEGKDDKVMTSLKWSYYELPALLKQCLLCFSVYPEDFEIRAEQLIHWWIAEGLVQQRNSKSAFEVGYECLLGLTSRCLVQVVEGRGFDGRVSSCKLHDIVRDLIIQIAEEEGFCRFNQKQGTQVWNQDSYWLAFNYEKDEKEKDEKVLGNNSKLRALLLKVKSPVDRIFGSSLPSLRMLDISGSNLDKKDVKNLLDWIGALKRLASLNLSGVEGLEDLPCSISGLLNLQILNLSGCTKLKKIHKSITQLKKLIVLKVGGCSSLEYLPRGLERLSNLQELTGFKVANQTNTKGCELTELRNLTNLRVLRIVISDEAVKVSERELNEILSELKELKILTINATECKREDVWKMVDSLTPPPSLLELYLYNYNGKKLPKWICPSKLYKLQYLSIENGDIVNMNPGAENVSSNCKWNVLEGLCLKQLPRLAVEWEDLKKVMPGLRYMEVSNCPNLANKNFPCSVEETGVWRD